MKSDLVLTVALLQRPDFALMPAIARAVILPGEYFAAGSPCLHIVRLTRGLYNAAEAFCLPGFYSQPWAGKFRRWFYKRPPITQERAALAAEKLRLQGGRL